jgi:hypothetical protein
MDTFVETLHSWQNFYFMTGGAAAALLGLMFVALSMGTHLLSDATRASFHFFVTPSVVYFMSGLLLCCVMLNPVYSAQGLALILFGGGIFGLMKTVPAVRQLFIIAKRNQDFDTDEWITQIILPPANYVLILIAALCLIINQESLAFTALWIANISLLICAVSSTWSLVMWIVNQPSQESE